MLWRKRDIRNGWCICPFLFTMAVMVFLVSFLDTGTYMYYDGDRSSTSITVTVPQAGVKITTADTPLWLPQQDAVDLLRFPPPSRHLYSQHEQGGITVAFPITKSSLSSFDSNFRSILSAQSSHSFVFYEILVACHPKIAAQTEQLIDKARRTHSFAIPVTVLPWSQSDNPTSGMLHILNSVLTSRVLLLDTTALRSMDEAVQTMLFDSIPIDFPIGPHGILISPSNLSCIHSLERTIPAAYLIPPILAPVRLLMEAENGVRLTANPWAALGYRIVKIRRAGFGGLALKSSRQSHHWCTNLLTAVDPTFASTFLRPFYEFLEKGAEDQSFTSVRLNVLLPGEDELMSFSPTLCEMAQRGYTLHILLFSWAAVDSSPNFALDIGCHLHFESIPSDTSTASLAKRLKAWSLVADFDVLMYTSERLVHTMVIESSVEWFRMSGGTIVRVPTADLPFCDWMAMLGVSDWQREYFLKCV
jgi:hypothetical protein